MADIMVRCDDSPHAIRWTRAECRQLAAAGLLGDRFELVEGVINKMGQNMPHASVVRLVLQSLYATFGPEYVTTQASIDVRPEDNPTNEPMPDAIVLNKPDTTFTNNPRPHEIRLLVEVSDSTVHYDLTVKARSYARAGIVDYWVISLPDRCITVHRNPVGGMYTLVQTFTETGSIAPLAAPDQPVRASNLLPERDAQ